MRFVFSILNSIRVHTNGIESIWRVAKMKIKQVGGIRRGHIQPYIHEFLWQQEIKCRGEDRFLAILNAIKNFIQQIYINFSEFVPASYPYRILIKL